MRFSELVAMEAGTIWRWCAAMLLSFVVGSAPLLAADYQVLVVMSYEEDNPWCEEIKEGIESVLGANSQLSYQYLDTKVDFAGGEAKAARAWQHYQQLQPDGVITVDDNAQWMFVLPYLQSEQTPVMFCGVNAEAEKYGFPTDFVSGTLERGHVRESIAFIKQLSPEVQRVGFLVKDSPSGMALEKQVMSEADSYLAEVSGFHRVTTTAELRQVAKILQQGSDAIYVDSLEGIVDEQGRALSHRQVFDILSAEYKNLVIGANRYHVVQGALSAVVKTGQEQGESAARMLLQAMQGTPVSQLPVTRNYHGRRLINVSTMRAFGIRPKPVVLRGASLVRTD